MNKHCVCDKAGFCERHKIEKDQRYFEYCKGISGAADCGYDYWIAWEHGNLGATAPEEPKLELWECINEVKRVVVEVRPTREYLDRRRPKPIESRPSGVGDVLAERLKKVGFYPVRGCKCKNVQIQLNKAGPFNIRNNINHWVTILHASAKSWKSLKGGIWTLVPTPPPSLFKKVLLEAVEVWEQQEQRGHMA